MTANIHPSAIVSPNAMLGQGVEIGAFTIIHENVEIGDGSIVGPYSELGVHTPLSDGSPLIIGARAHIRSHAVFYTSSRFGEDLSTGHRVTVREHTIAGENLRVGTLSDIQGDCSIGDYVRMHSNVHVGKKSTLGNFVWVFPYVVLTNDPTPPSEVLLGPVLEDYSVIATMAVVLPGVRIGKHALVAASACVSKDVPEGMVAGGIPAKILGETRHIARRDQPDQSAYPWPKHFSTGYPDAVRAQWAKEYAIAKGDAA